MNAPNDLGRFQARRRRVLAVLVAVIFLALLFVRSETTPDDALHEYVEWIGGALILIAILGRTWCTLYIGGRKSAEVVTRRPLFRDPQPSLCLFRDRRDRHRRR